MKASAFICLEGAAPPTDGKKHICGELRVVHNLIGRRMHAFGDGTDCADKTSALHGWVLGYLYHNRGTTVYQRTLQDQFGLSRSGVTALVQQLERKGYVERSGARTDARRKELCITESGCEAHQRLLSHINEVEDEVARQLTPQEQEQLLFLLEKLKSALSK